MKNDTKKIVLGIETSCDETAVGIVSQSSDGSKEIMANVVLSQLDEHKAYGGVVPEIAARAHMEHIDTLIETALKEADINLSDVDAVAATTGPGLVGGVMVGMMAGKVLAATQKIPFIAVNHLEAHLLTARLTHDVSFPYLVLLVSGGHTQLLVAEGLGQYKCLGGTLDDALGECFDKSAKLMGLGYPGGPQLEKMALKCQDQQAAENRFPLPLPMKGREGHDFSFSGLKTAVRQHIDKLPAGDLQEVDVADLAYAFQVSVGKILDDRCSSAIKTFKANYDNPQLAEGKSAFVVCGGVAANQYLRGILHNVVEKQGMEFIAPPVKLCSDNGLMIAWVGMEKFMDQQFDCLDIAARPRWPLEELRNKQEGV